MADDILFVSGWAGYPALFPELSKRGEFLLPFLEHGESEINRRLEASTARVLVGWSLGAHLILRRWARVHDRYERIVLVSPYLAFGDYTGPKVLKFMHHKLRDGGGQDVVRVWARNCGFPGRLPFEPEHAAPLLVGLESMMGSRAMPSHLGAGRVTLVHGQHDRIIAPEACEDILEIMVGAGCVSLAGGHWVDEGDLLSLI